MKAIRNDGKKWVLPETLMFGRDRCFYEVDEFRPPKKGEWFISGATAGGYQTAADLDHPYLIAVRRVHALRATGYTRGAPVEGKSMKNQERSPFSSSLPR